MVTIALSSHGRLVRSGYLLVVGLMASSLATMSASSASDRTTIYDGAHRSLRQVVSRDAHLAQRWDNVTAIAQMYASVKDDLVSLVTKGLEPPFFMACFKRDHVCDQIRRDGYRLEWKNILGPLITALRPGVDTFLDIGSNTGFFGLAAAMRGVRTISIEPAQANIVRLNAALNNLGPERFEFHAVALVDQPGAGPLRMRLPYQNMGSATAVDPANTTGWTDLFEDGTPHIDLTVPTATLDEVLWESVLKPRRHVRLLKIDTEGYEMRVWRGAHNLLSSGLVETIISEWHPKFLQSAGVHPVEYLRFLRSYNYSLARNVIGASRWHIVSPMHYEAWAHQQRDAIGDIMFVRTYGTEWPPPGSVNASWSAESEW